MGRGMHLSGSIKGKVKDFVKAAMNLRFPQIRGI
jgi:hypothetical protein